MAVISAGENQMPNFLAVILMGNYTSKIKKERKLFPVEAVAMSTLLPCSKSWRYVACSLPSYGCSCHCNFTISNQKLERNLKRNA